MILSRVFLFPYWLVLKLRNALWDSGRRKAVQHPVPVISVGNLTVGGTGCTLSFNVQGQTRSVRTEDAFAELQEDVENDILKQRKIIRAFNFITHYDGIKR